MSHEKILEDLKNNCKLKQSKKKIFSVDEVKAVHLMMDDGLSITATSSFFKTSTKRITKLINLLKEFGDDYFVVCEKINN